MRVVLNLNNKTYTYTTLLTKRKISGAISRLESQNGSFTGTCTVKYSAGNYNSFDFDSASDLRYKIGPCLEPELVREYA